jgi:hypothetical protein
VISRDRLAGESHLTRDLQRDSCRQAGATARRHEATLHFRDAERRVVSCDDKVGAHHHFEATGRCMTVNGGDHRLRTVVEQLQSTAHRRHVLAGRERFEVHPDTEVLFAGTGHDDGADQRVRRRTAERFDEALADRRVERVASFGPVDGEEEHALA